MNNRIKIIGAGGFGHEVRSIAQRLGYSFEGFLDDLRTGDEIVGRLMDFTSEDHLVLAIGQSKLRMQAWSKIKSNVDISSCPNLFDDRATFYESLSSLGFGNIIAPGSTLTTNIRMNDFNVININATVGHNTRFGSFVSIMPGAHISGDVYLEDGVYVGSGAVILQGLHIGENSIIGAGSVVTKDIPANQIVMGVPGKQK